MYPLWFKCEKRSSLVNPCICMTRQVWNRGIKSFVNINNTFLRQSEPMSLWFNPRYEMWGRGQSSYHRSDLIVNTNTHHINDTLASAPVIDHDFADVNAMVNGLPDVPCPRWNLIIHWDILGLITLIGERNSFICYRVKTFGVKTNWTFTLLLRSNYRKKGKKLSLSFFDFLPETSKQIRMSGINVTFNLLLLSKQDNTNKLPLKAFYY